MEQLSTLEQCIDELEQGFVNDAAFDRQQLASAIKLLQALLAHSAPLIEGIIPIQPLPGAPSQHLIKRLQLEVAYDHSNSKMPLNILVSKALENYRFNDLLTLSQYVSIEQLKKTSETPYGEAAPKRLNQILRNIEPRMKATVQELASQQSTNHNQGPS